MKKRIPPRARCPRIPVRPELNPITQTKNEKGLLHYNYINRFNHNLFPFPKYRVVVYSEEPIPPCFYIYCKNTAVSVSMIDGKINGVKKKGRNPKIIKYIAKNLNKWLNSQIASNDYAQTNLQAIREEWWHPCYRFSLDGQLMKMEDWEKLPEAQDDYPYP